MNDLRRTAGTLINEIANPAIVAAASAGVVLLAGTTTVGLPLALVLGAFALTRVYKVADGIRQPISLIVKAEAAAKAYESSLGAFGRIDSDEPLPKLPR